MGQNGFSVVGSVFSDRLLALMDDPKPLFK